MEAPGFLDEYLHSCLMNLLEEREGEYSVLAYLRMNHTRSDTVKYFVYNKLALHPE